MTIDLNNAAANIALDLYDTFFPAGSVLELRTGGPLGAEAAASGTLLVSITLPATPWNAAASGSKSKNGTWSGAGVAAGTIGHYRLRNAGDTRREEGTVTATGGGGDATVDNVSVAVDQVVTINTFTRTS
jgi:hypothetical protein